MEKIVIEGKTKLKGEVTISGAKNAAVAILPATILVNGICTIDNIPDISDIKMYCKILESIGVKIKQIAKNTLEIDSRNITSVEAPLDLTSKFRASYYLSRSLTWKMSSRDSRNARRMPVRGKANGSTYKGF